MDRIFEVKVTLMHHTKESDNSGFDVNRSIKTNPHPPPKKNEKAKQEKTTNKQNTFNKIKPFFIIKQK